MNYDISLQRETAEEIRIGSKLRIKISMQKGGVEFVKIDKEVHGARSMRTYFLPKDYWFLEGHEIRAEINDYSIAHDFTKDGRRKIYIYLRNPRRVYSYRIDASGDFLKVQLWCGKNFIKARNFPLKEKRFEGICDGNICRFVEKSFTNGKIMRTWAKTKEPLSEAIKSQFARVKHVFPKAGPEHMRRIKNALNQLPHLDKDPAYDYIAERDKKRRRPHEVQII